MQNRFKSPVVWGVSLGVVLTQLQQLRSIETLSWWDVAIAAVTIAISVVGALNNPKDNENF